jgi:hypothetical protein
MTLRLLRMTILLLIITSLSTKSHTSNKQITCKFRIPALKETINLNIRSFKIYTEGIKLVVNTVTKSLTDNSLIQSVRQGIHSEKYKDIVLTNSDKDFSLTDSTDNESSPISAKKLQYSENTEIYKIEDKNKKTQSYENNIDININQEISKEDHYNEDDHVIYPYHKVNEQEHGDNDNKTNNVERNIYEGQSLEGECHEGNAQEYYNPENYNNEGFSHNNKNEDFNKEGFSHKYINLNNEDYNNIGFSHIGNDKEGFSHKDNDNDGFSYKVNDNEDFNHKSNNKEGFSHKSNDNNNKVILNQENHNHKSNTQKDNLRKFLALHKISIRKTHSLENINPIITLADTPKISTQRDNNHKDINKSKLRKISTSFHKVNLHKTTSQDNNRKSTSSADSSPKISPLEDNTHNKKLRKISTTYHKVNVHKTNLDMSTVMTANPSISSHRDSNNNVSTQTNFRKTSTFHKAKAHSIHSLINTNSKNISLADPSPKSVRLNEKNDEFTTQTTYRLLSNKHNDGSFTDRLPEINVRETNEKNSFQNTSFNDEKHNVNSYTDRLPKNDKENNEKIQVFKTNSFNKKKNTGQTERSLKVDFIENNDKVKAIKTGSLFSRKPNKGSLSNSYPISTHSKNSDKTRAHRQTSLTERKHNNDSQADVNIEEITNKHTQRTNKQTFPIDRKYKNKSHLYTNSESRYDDSIQDRKHDNEINKDWKLNLKTKKKRHLKSKPGKHQRVNFQDFELLEHFGQLNGNAVMLSFKEIFTLLYNEADNNLYIYFHGEDKSIGIGIAYEKIHTAIIRFVQFLLTHQDEFTESQLDYIEDYNTSFKAEIKSIRHSFKKVDITPPKSPITWRKTKKFPNLFAPL